MPPDPTPSPQSLKRPCLMFSKSHSSSSPTPAEASDRTHSDADLCWNISTSGSISARNAASSACSATSSVGYSGMNMRPSLMFELCGMTTTSHPDVTSHVSRMRRQKPHGSGSSKCDTGVGGTFAFRKTTLRCRLLTSRADVYS